MITGTVAVPIWRSKLIAWLCMESLCRQHKPVNGWELIVFEEDHPDKVGVNFIVSYEDRLIKAGCEDIKFIKSDNKYPLSQKWVTIAKNAVSESEYFILCAADNYYSPWMIQDAEKDIKSANWCIVTKGYFYDLNLDKILRYDYKSRIGLQMAALTDKVKKFPMDIVNKGVDMWLSRQMGNSILINESDHWKKMLCTNGLNNISIEREELFKDIKPPYYRTRIKLEDIVPGEIAKRLKTLSQWLKSQ